MEAQEIIDYIATSPKRTPVKAYVREAEGARVAYPADAHVFGDGRSKVVFADWGELGPALEAAGDSVEDLVVEYDRRNSGVPLLDVRGVNARIEPGAIIRERVEIGDNAVVMMGAIINIGAVVGEGTMIDMGAVLGGRAIVGRHCHIGAGTVLAGVVEPASATPVVIEDDVMIGANAVVIEGCRVGRGSVVAAGAVVTRDVPAGVVVAGCPARVIRRRTRAPRPRRRWSTPCAPCSGGENALPWALPVPSAGRALALAAHPCERSAARGRGSSRLRPPRQGRASPFESPTHAPPPRNDAGALP